MRLLISLTVVLVLQACKHPLVIVGEGDIVDLRGSGHGCTLEQFREDNVACTDNEADGDYIATYGSEPRPGWKFVGWEGVCPKSSPRGTCEFNVVSNGVAFWDALFPGIAAPSTTAVFQQIDDSDVPIAPPQNYFLHFYPGQFAAVHDGLTLGVSNEITVELWLYMEKPFFGDLMRSGADSEGFSMGFFQEAGSNDTLSMYWGESRISSPQPIPLKEWTHIAITADGSALRLFVNGTRQKIQQSGSVSITDSLPLRIGMEFGRGCQCNLREVRIWRRARTGNQILSTMSAKLSGRESALAAYWPLDDGQGQSARNLASAEPLVFGNSLESNSSYDNPHWRLSNPFYEILDDAAPDIHGNTHFPEEEHPLGVVNGYAVADLNSDGLSDFIYSGPENFAGEDVRVPYRVLVNDGSGGFRLATSEIISGPVPRALHASDGVAGDFNGDGQPDFFGAGSGLDLLEGVGEINTLFLSRPDGKYEDATHTIQGPSCTRTSRAYESQNRCSQLDHDATYPEEGSIAAPPVDYTHTAAVGDVDNDGDLDIFAGNVAAYFVHTVPYFLMNDGEGGFSPSWQGVPTTAIFGTEFGGGGNSRDSVELFDVDQDGNVDLLLSGKGPPAETDVGNSLIYWGDGTGNFRVAPWTVLPDPEGFQNQPARRYLFTDIDGDSDIDIIRPTTTNLYLAAYVQVLINQGGRNFIDESAERIATQEFPERWFLNIAEIDINLDSCPDFVLMMEVPDGDYSDHIWINDCSGNFSPLNSAIIGDKGLLIPIDTLGDGGADFLLYRQTDDFIDGEFRVVGKFSVVKQLRPFTALPEYPE